MLIRLTLFSVTISIIFMILVLVLIRRGYLTIRYALLWLVAGLTFIIFTIFPKSLEVIAKSIGIVTPVNALFFLGLITVLFLLLALTVAISLLARKNEILSQELAIRDSYIRDLQEKITSISYVTNIFYKIYKAPDIIEKNEKKMLNP